MTLASLCLTILDKRRIPQKYQVKEIEDGIGKLSDRFRYTLANDQVSMVSLDKEIDYLNSYIELQRMRFTYDQLTIKFKVEGDHSQVQIHQMILIPFIENVFKYSMKHGQNSFVMIESTLSHGNKKIL